MSDKKYIPATVMGDGLSYFGCFTGDCPDDDHKCDDEIRKYCGQMEAERLELQQQLSEANYALEKATDVIEEKGRERNKAILMLDEANSKLDKARECLKQIDYWNDDPKHYPDLLNQ